MPYLHHAGADIYWSSFGKGEPVLLIMGLSYTHEMWFRLLPAIAAGHRAILFDNRGMGRSSVPKGPYRIRTMAGDALAVLRAAGENSAHVAGASMGGMIAQEMALRSPGSVRSLALACTSHSGLFGAWPDFSCLPFTPKWKHLDRTERERRLIRLLYADGTPASRIEEDMRVVSASTWTKTGFRNQFAGILLWTAYRRLPRLRIPTLVVHGEQDRLIPLVNGRVLANRIPGAQFRPVPNAGHLLTTDQPQMCSNLITEFLGKQTSSSSTPIALELPPPGDCVL